MSLQIELRDEGAMGRRASLRGRLDTVTAPALDGRLEPVLGDPAITLLVLDLAGLEYISSAGIRSMMKARRALEGRHGSVVIVDPQPAVRKVLDIIKALPVEQIFASTAELDAYLDAMQRRARRPG
jgi:anti-anti-sigma factor